MDGQRFDGLARRLAAAGTRRGALGLLAGGALGLVLGGEPAAARRRRCRRRGQTCSRRTPCCGRQLHCASNANPLTGRVCCSQDGGGCSVSSECCGTLVCSPASNTCIK